MKYARWLKLQRLVGRRWFWSRRSLLRGQQVLCMLMPAVNVVACDRKIENP